MRCVSNNLSILFFLISLVVLVLVVSLKNTYAESLSFSPTDYDFIFVLGPQGKIMTKSPTCESPKQLMRIFGEWRTRLGETVTTSPDCQCGKEEIEIKTFDFF